MKNIILSLVMLCSSAAMAQATPVQVSQECIRQMSLGICMPIPDRSILAPGAARLFSGLGRLDAFAYQDYADLYNPITPTDPAMCELALYKMSNAPGSDHDKIARALWTPLPDAEKHTDPATIAAAAIALAMAGIGAATLVAARKPQEKAGA